MKPWLYPGAKVVCVDAAPRHGLYYSQLLVAGKTYTVASVEPDCQWANDRGVGVHLLEIARTPSVMFRRPMPWNVDRFRPLIDTTKQIEALKKIARDAFTSGRVDA